MVLVSKYKNYTLISEAILKVIASGYFTQDVWRGQRPKNFILQRN